MKSEQSAIEKKLETRETGEASLEQESPEVFKLRLIKKSEEEAGAFQVENEKIIGDVENRASEEGFDIDNQDKEELVALGREAGAAKEEFLAVVGNGRQEEQAASGQETAQKTILDGKKKIHALFSAGKGQGSDYAALSALLMKRENGKNIWKSSEETDADAVGKMLEKIDQEEAFNAGKEKILSLHAKGENKSSGYRELHLSLTKTVEGKVVWKNASETDAENVKKLLVALEEKGTEPHEGKEKDFVAAENTIVAEKPVVAEQKSGMKERIIEDSELMSAKEASKKLLSEERVKLAQEIREQRNLQRGRLSRLKAVAEKAQETIGGEQGDRQYGKISEFQSRESDLMAERISAGNLTEQEAQEEKENLNELIDSSSAVKSLKEKLEEHYAKAGEAAKERFEKMNRSIEHVIKRNNAFLVHVLTEMEGVRHNENSNVSSEATIEDDLDMLLSLEPSISASSVISGKQSSLWAGGSFGVLLGGGQVGEAGHGDLGTHPDGIKGRRSAGGIDASIEEIDEVVGRNKGTHGGMNEIVVHNTEVAGFFQAAEKDEEGRFWIYNLKQKDYSEKMEKEKSRGWGPQTYTKIFQGNLSRFRDKFSMAESRGIPQYIMTSDRELYECLRVNDNGSVEVGDKLTPEDVAKGRAGLSAEKRKEIGEKLLEKKIFRKQETMDEAREIVESF